MVAAEPAPSKYTKQLPEHNQPLLWPTPNELALAPELGVLAALDATLASAAWRDGDRIYPFSVDW